MKIACVFQVAAFLSSIFILQSISVCMEMLQRQAHQRRSHVFSTAGRSEVLPTNLVPEDPQRGLRQCVRAATCLCVHSCLFFMHMHVRGWACYDGEYWN